MTAFKIANRQIKIIVIGVGSVVIKAVAKKLRTTDLNNESLGILTSNQSRNSLTKIYFSLNIPENGP